MLKIAIWLAVGLSATLNLIGSCVSRGRQIYDSKSQSLIWGEGQVRTQVWFADCTPKIWRFDAAIAPYLFLRPVSTPWVFKSFSMSIKSTRGLPLFWSAEGWSAHAPDTNQQLADVRYIKFRICQIVCFNLSYLFCWFSEYSPSRFWHFQRAPERGFTFLLLLCGCVSLSPPWGEVSNNMLCARSFKCEFMHCSAVLIY